MKRFRQRIDHGDVIESPSGEFYLVSEVDARIAELEQQVNRLSGMVACSVPLQRIAKLEMALREMTYRNTETGQILTVKFDATKLMRELGLAV